MGAVFVSTGVCRVDPLVRATPCRCADHSHSGRRAGQHGVRAPDRDAGRPSALADNLSSCSQRCWPRSPSPTISSGCANHGRPPRGTRIWPSRRPAPREACPFVALTAAIALAACASYAIIVNLVPLMTELPHQHPGRRGRGWVWAAPARYWDGWVTSTLVAAPECPDPHRGGCHRRNRRDHCTAREFLPR